MSCVMNCYQSPPFLCCRVINRNSFSSAWGINFAYTQQVFEQLLSVRRCVKCWDTKRRSHSVSTCRVLEMDEQMGTIMWKCISQSCTVLGRKIGQWQNAQRKITSARGDREKGFESLLSQNGMCKCEACSIWAGPQMFRSLPSRRELRLHTSWMTHGCVEFGNCLVNFGKDRNLVWQDGRARSRQGGSDWRWLCQAG